MKIGGSRELRKHCVFWEMDSYMNFKIPYPDNPQLVGSTAEHKIFYSNIKGPFICTVRKGYLPNSYDSNLCCSSAKNNSLSVCKKKILGLKPFSLKTKIVKTFQEYLTNLLVHSHLHVNFPIRL